MDTNECDKCGQTVHESDLSTVKGQLVCSSC